MAIKNLLLCCELKSLAGGDQSGQSTNIEPQRNPPFASLLYPSYDDSCIPVGHARRRMNE
eukprot:scaffold151956_cov18-Prasinocladus_malaysianus.AAC.1